MSRPLAIDLFCGLGGWTDALLAEGYDVIGFDIERHVYGEHRYPGMLVVQDVRTLHGSQLRTAALLVASPPCQEPSYRAMPWKKAKALNAAGPPVKFIELFDTCFRLQREACEAAGRHIPLIVENVRGAQKWIGRARWNYGSFYLWGDVPALMPITLSGAKVPGLNWSGSDKPGYVAKGFNTTADQRVRDGSKNAGGSWFNVAHNTTSGKGQNPDGRKVPGLKHGQFPPGGLAQRHMDGSKGGGDWFGSGDNASVQRRHASKSNGRKMASAMIAKIPLPLGRHIAATFRASQAELTR